jgi:hypothetical protein
MSAVKIGRYAVVETLTTGEDEDVLVAELAGRRFAIRLFSLIDRETLLEDARRIASLSHPNIAHQEVGLHEERPFLAAELAGTSLEAWLGEYHSLPEQLRVIEGVAGALAHAHGEGLAHGRLTPGRIVVAADGSARVWGFSVRGANPDRVNADYIAPEVLESGAPTPQADVYSAGMICYEILAGVSAAGEAPRPLRELRKDVPKDLADAVMACRERAVDWRPKDLDYLLEVAHKLRGSAPAPKPKPGPQPAVATPRPRSAGGRRGGPPLLPLAIVSLLVLGGAAAYYFLVPGAGSLTPSPTPRPSAVPAAPAASPSTAVASPSAAPSPSTAPAVRAADAKAAVAPAPTATPAPSAPPVVPATPRPAAPATIAPAPTTTTLPPAPTTLAAAPTPPPAPNPTGAPPGPPQVSAVSPPSLRRGQRTLVDVRGQNLYAGLSAALLRGGRPAEGVRVVQQRFVNSTLLQVFIEVDAQAASGGYAVLLSDGMNVTNSVRVDVAR